MKKELKFFLSLKNKLVSVNDMYKAKIGYKNSRPYPIIYKDPKSVLLSKEIRDQLRATDFSEHIDWIRETKQFNLLVQFIFKSGITRRDTSNYIKLIEDQVVNFLKEDLGIEKYDDSKHVEVHLYKAIIPKAKEEYVCVKLMPSNFNIRFDITPQPENIYIGREIEKKIVSKFKKEKLKLFTEYSESLDTILFELRPDIDNLVDFIFKVNNNINKNQLESSGFTWVAIYGTEEEWGSKYNDVLKIIENIEKLESVKVRWIKSDITEMIT